MDVLLVLYELVAHLLIEVSTGVAQLRKELKCILYKVETVNIVLYTYIECCGDCTLLHA